MKNIKTFGCISEWNKTFNETTSRFGPDFDENLMEAGSWNLNRGEANRLSYTYIYIYILEVGIDKFF